MARTRRTLSAAISIATALAVVVLPGAAHADETRVVDAQGCGDGTVLDSTVRHWANGDRATARIWVYQGGSKTVASNDEDADDGIALGIMVDPDGPADPIVYVDLTPEDGIRAVHCFGYAVRKWKWVSTYQGTKRIHGDELPWQVSPLPYPGF